MLRKCTSRLCAEQRTLLYTIMFSIYCFLYLLISSTLPFFPSFFPSTSLLSVPPFFSPSLHPPSLCFPPLFLASFLPLPSSVDSSLLLSLFPSFLLSQQQKLATNNPHQLTLCKQIWKLPLSTSTKIPADEKP